MKMKFNLSMYEHSMCYRLDSPPGIVPSDACPGVGTPPIDADDDIKHQGRPHEWPTWRVMGVRAAGEQHRRVTEKELFQLRRIAEHATNTLPTVEANEHKREKHVRTFTPDVVIALITEVERLRGELFTRQLALGTYQGHLRTLLGSTTLSAEHIEAVLACKKEE